DQRGVDGRDVTGGDQPQRRVAGRRDDVVVTGLHQGDRLVGGGEVLDVRLAAGLLLERGDPVDVLVVGAVLGVARPGQDVDLALHLPDGLLHRDVRRGEALGPRRGRTTRSGGRATAGHERKRGDAEQGTERGALPADDLHAVSSVSSVTSESAISEPRWSATATGRSEAASGGSEEAAVLGRETVRLGPASSSTMAWVIGPR